MRNGTILLIRDSFYLSPESKAVAATSFAICELFSGTVYFFGTIGESSKRTGDSFIGTGFSFIEDEEP